MNQCENIRLLMAAARLLYLARPSLHIMNTMRYVKIHSSRRNTYSLHRFYLIPHCVSYTLHFLITRAPLPPTSFPRLFLCRHEGEWADTGKARSIVYICAVPLIPHMSEIFVIYEILAYAMNIPCNVALYLLNSKSTTS